MLCCPFVGLYHFIGRGPSHEGVFGFRVRFSPLSTVLVTFIDWHSIAYSELVAEYESILEEAE
jgi:hypothetical protein